jgi:ABC-type nitrate/sulfonate/bicarbonate transport system permease component
MGIRVVGFLLLPIVWFLLKDIVHVTDRYLPSITAVLSAGGDIVPNVFVHFAYTTSRFTIGFLLGLFVGVSLGLLIFKYVSLFDLLMPTIQATRAVPAIAIVPFFILWFGFSESGRYLLTVVGTAFNIAVATYQIVSSVPERHRIMFKSFGLRPEDLTLRYGLPRVVEEILPTLRFSLAAAIGLIVASELLGSQVGLGYLIQTSRSTFSMHVIFLAMILLGILNVSADWLLRHLWSRLVFWRL